MDQLDRMKGFVFLSMWSNEIRNHNFLKRKLHLKRRFLLFLEMTVMIIFVDQQGV